MVLALVVWKTFSSLLEVIRKSAKGVFLRMDVVRLLPYEYRLRLCAIGKESSTFAGYRNLAALTC
jgi:hypothetical protein